LFGQHLSFVFLAGKNVSLKIQEKYFPMWDNNFILIDKSLRKKNEVVVVLY